MDDAFALSDRFVEDLAALRPVAATRSGVSGYDDRLDDLGPNGHAKTRDLLGSYRDRFAALPADGDRWNDHARSAGLEFLARHLDTYEAEDHLRDLNSVFSPFQTMRQVFDVMDPDTETGWQDIVSRLGALPTALDRYRTTLEEGRRRGLTTARRQVNACLSEGRVNAGEQSFFGTLEAAFRDSGVHSDRVAAHLAEAAEGARGAYGEFTDYLERTYLPDAVPADGVGRERYERAARRFLGTDIDIEEVYQWGWDRVHDLWNEMQSVAEDIDPGRQVSEVVQLLETDPDRCVASPQEFVEAMQERQEQAVSALDGTHFEIPEAARKVTISLAPPGGALGAYYVSPSEDFSRPGSIWYSVGDQQVFPLYDEVSTAYHEGFPGHHLQAAIVMGLGDRISRLQRTFAWSSGSGEGWALYAERLMGELGFLEKPDYVLGMLASHMFRACRVVIDLGCHLGLQIPRDALFHPGESWGFDLAVEMLTDYAFLRPAVARSEVTRYLGWPGQAISYKYGERTILGLREELRSRQGRAFQLKDFHAGVLSAGAVGLDLLRSFVLG